MELDTGLKELEYIEAQFLSGEISIRRVQSLVYSAFLNNSPYCVFHPSDINEIGAIADSLSETVELIEHSKSSQDYSFEVSALIKKAKENLKRVHEKYPKRAKN